MWLSIVCSVLLILILLGLGKCIPILTSSIRISIAVKNLPKPHQRHWLFGQLPYIMNKDHGAMQGILNMTLPLAKQGHKIVSMNAGPGRNSVHLLHPETIRDAIGSDPKFKTVYHTLEPWLGDGLLTSSGAKWSRHRKLLTKAFHFDILKSYVEIFTDCASVFVDCVGKANASSAVVDIVPYIRLLTLDILLRCICGQETNCQILGTHVPYVESIHSLSELAVQRLVSPFARYDLIYAFHPLKKLFSKHCHIVHKFAVDVIEKRKNILSCKANSDSANGKKYLDFIDVLLAAKDENGQGLSDHEIREEVDTFMFEGHDTTANSLCWTIYLLAKHPEHQAKCREEVDNLFDKKDVVEWDDLKELTYLHCCMKEANRLYPPVPSISRQLAAPRKINGCQLPKGIPVVIQIYVTHHNPHVWEEPEVFNPVRFTPENSKNRDPLAFIPFSAGPRNCIGQNFAVSEEKVVLAVFLRNFEFSLDKQHTTEMKRFLLLQPDKVYLKLQKR